MGEVKGIQWIGLAGGTCSMAPGQATVLLRCAGVVCGRVSGTDSPALHRSLVVKHSERLEFWSRLAF